MEINLERREFHIRNAIASFALEGEHPSPYVINLLDKFKTGEIKTIEELRGMLIKGEGEDEQQN